MLIQNSVYRNTYVANGTTTTFAYTTPILDASWLTVYQQLPDTGDEEQTIVSPSDYTLTGVGNPAAGNVVFNEAPANGTRLAIVLSVPITQLYKYTELDNFPAESHEDALAKLTLICQMLAEKAARAVTVAETSTRDPSEYSDDFFVTAEQVQANADQVASDKQDVLDAIDGFDAHVEEKKGEATTAIEGVTTTQIGLVEDEGDAQVARVQTEGGAQVTAAEAAAERAETAAEEAEEIVRPTPATTEKLGLVQIGSGINVDEDGVISAQEVNIATTQAAGIVKVGDNLSITPDGTLSADAQGGSTYTDEITDLDVADYADGTMVVTSESVDSDDSVLGGVPVGTIIWSMKATVPAGYLLCNGSAVGRETYPELFQAIGTTFGSGDGSTTFNLPNLIDRFIEGGNAAGTVKAAGLPNIEGSVYNSGGTQALFNQNGTEANGALELLTAQNLLPANNSENATTYLANIRMNLNASLSNPIYGNSDTVQPPAVTALPCIKAFASVIGDATVVAGQLVNEIESCAKLDGSNIEYAGAELKKAMALMGMPSEQYIDLTLPTSGGTITAPADGWLNITYVATSTVGELIVSCSANGVSGTGYEARDHTNAQGYGMTVLLPVKQGMVVSITGANIQFHRGKFFYANGTAPTA